MTEQKGKSESFLSVWLGGLPGIYISIWFVSRVAFWHTICKMGIDAVVDIIGVSTFFALLAIRDLIRAGSRVSE
jgi:hypothetical protein